MIQTNLKPEFTNSESPRDVCLGKHAMVWIAYGLAMAALWGLPSGHVGSSDAPLWAIAWVVGIGIAFVMKEA